MRTSCPQGTRAGYGVCRQSIHGLTPNWPASLPATLRADPPPARRCRWAPGRAPRHRGADSVRRGVAAARARLRAAFGVPHTSDRPERSRAAAESKGAVGGSPSTSAFGLRSGRTAEVWRLCPSAEGDRKPLTLLAQQEASRLKSLLQVIGATQAKASRTGCAPTAVRAYQGINP